MVAQDVSTAVFGLLNAGYFAHYWWRRSRTRARRLGAATLALVSAAAVVEALFSQGLFWSEQGVVSQSLLSPPIWALVRLPLFIATVIVSIIVLRRLLS